jgi:copper transport protein
LLQPENEIMAPIARAADPGKDGIWRVENLNLPMGGPWVVEVEVRVGDFELTKIGGTVTIE